jgi:hypothetical protein
MFVQEEKKLTTYLIESFVCLNACNEQKEKKKKKKKKKMMMLFSFIHHHYHYSIHSNI